MKLESISFKNFRQHRAVDVDLAGDTGLFVIVKGNNGAGKTNFFNGITWCLYESIDDSTKFLKESLVSQGAILEAKEGDEIIVEVSINMTLSNGGSAKISRQYFYIKADGEPKIVRQNFEVMSMANFGVGFQKIQDSNDWIDENLPRRFSPYFLFDGERLDRFFRKDDARFIRDSVLQIANIDVLENMNTRLQQVAEELLRTAAKGSGSKGEELAKQNQQFNERLEVENKNLSLKKDEVQGLADSIQQLSSKIGNVAETAADFDRRKEIIQNLDAAQKRLDASEGDLSSWAVQNAPHSLGMDALASLKAEIDVARVNKVLPPPFTSETLTDLLERGRCLCERELVDGSESCNHIKDLLSKYNVVSDLGEVLSSLEPQLLSIINDSQSARSGSDVILDRIRTAKTDFASLKKKLDVLNAKLAGHNDEEIATLHQNLRRAEESRDLGQREIGRLEATIESVKADLTRNTKEINAQSDLSEKAAEALKNSKFANNALVASQKIYRELCDQVRNDVANSLDRQFKDMLWKKDFIEKVDIDENFRVSVINNTDFEILDKLAAGERTCLAFAFSLALSSVAGLAFPMVVDSPMGRLGPEMQSNLAGVLAEKTKMTIEGETQQIIMLMTATEYTSDVAKILASRNPRVFNIDVDVAKSETKIVKELN